MRISLAIVTMLTRDERYEESYRTRWEHSSLGPEHEKRGEDGLSLAISDFQYSQLHLDSHGNCQIMCPEHQEKAEQYSWLQADEVLLCANNASVISQIQSITLSTNT